MSCFKNLGLGLVVLSLCLSPLSADDSALEAELDKAIEKKDWIKATDLFEKLCDKGANYACFNAGANYSTPKQLIEITNWPIKQDCKKAMRYFEKACSLGNNEGCKEAKELKNNKDRCPNG